MRKVYAVLYNFPTISRAKVKAWANDSSSVLTWRCDLPGAFYLVSEGTATTLSRELHERLGPRGRFLITEVTDNTYGWLPKDTWYLLKNKRLRPKPTDKKQLS